MSGTSDGNYDSATWEVLVLQAEACNRSGRSALSSCNNGLSRTLAAYTRCHPAWRPRWRSQLALGTVRGAVSRTQLEERLDNGSWSRICSSGSALKRSGRQAGKWCYRVRAETNGISSAWSTVRCTTIAAYTPRNFSASDGEYSGRVHLAWSEVPDATYYKLYRNTASHYDAIPITVSPIRRTSHDNYDADAGEILLLSGQGMQRLGLQPDTAIPNADMHPITQTAAQRHQQRRRRRQLHG